MRVILFLCAFLFVFADPPVIFPEGRVFHWCLYEDQLCTIQISCHQSLLIGECGPHSMGSVIYEQNSSDEATEYVFSTSDCSGSVLEINSISLTDCNAVGLQRYVKGSISRSSWIPATLSIIISTFILFYH